VVEAPPKLLEPRRGPVQLVQVGVPGVVLAERDQLSFGLALDFELKRHALAGVNGHGGRIQHKCV